MMKTRVREGAKSEEPLAAAADAGMKSDCKHTKIKKEKIIVKNNLASNCLFM